MDKSLIDLYGQGSYHTILYFPDFPFFLLTRMMYILTFYIKQTNTHTHTQVSTNTR